MKSGLVHEKVTATKEQEDWLTPPYIVETLGSFDLDPCGAPDPKPFKTANKYYTLPNEDGLMLPWAGRVWLNPPYGPKATPFIKKLAEHNNGICLIFARTETKIFQEVIFKKASGILFMAGRVKFYKPDGNLGDTTSGAPSSLISFGEENFLAIENALKNKTLAGKLFKI